MPVVRVRLLYAPKEGCAPEEYEDAFWPPRSGWRRAARFRAALADGATEASFSAQWAHLLARACGSGTLDSASLEAALPVLQDAWRAEIAGRSLPWYAEEKARQGAFSSILGLTLRDDPSGPSWEALAVGDTCMVLVRGQTVAECFPLSHSAAFTSTPYLVASNPCHNSHLAHHARVATGSCISGDHFFLMTDALACWFLAQAERGGSPWLELAGMSRARFSGWLKRARDGDVIRNDDTTLLSVRLL